MPGFEFLPDGPRAPPPVAWMHAHVFTSLRRARRNGATSAELNNILYDFAQSLGAARDTRGYLVAETIRAALFDTRRPRATELCWARVHAFLELGRLEEAETAFRCLLARPRLVVVTDLGRLLGAYLVFRRHGGASIDFSVIRPQLRRLGARHDFDEAASAAFATDAEIGALSAHVDREDAEYCALRDRIDSYQSGADLDLWFEVWSASPHSEYLQESVGRYVSRYRSWLAAPSKDAP